MIIRNCTIEDLAILKRLTLEGFEGIAIDQNIETKFGEFAGHDWRWRKARQVDEDFAANPDGCFVVEKSGVVIGYITTRLDRSSGKGRIPNLAVDQSARGLGLGRRLIEHALDYFRLEGMCVATIETMENNPVGQHLYPSTGFVEVGRQIHYAMKVG